MEYDPFDGLLGLEDGFYDEGYKLGVTDGTRAGHIEGRLFGLEKGFEKYKSMGKLHGRVTVWASRLSHSQKLGEERPFPKGRVLENGRKDFSSLSTQNDDVQLRVERDVKDLATSDNARDMPLPVLTKYPRLEKHVQTLYALVEPDSLSTQNNEDAVADFDDRLKRAQGKVKIIEKTIHEESLETTEPGAAIKHVVERNTSNNGSGSIEDISSSHARH